MTFKRTFLDGHQEKKGRRKISKVSEESLNLPNVEQVFQSDEDEWANQQQSLSLLYSALTAYLPLVDDLREPQYTNL